MKKNNSSGFTLLELLIVIGIIGVLSVSFISFLMAREKIERYQLVGEQLSSVGQAMEKYLTDAQISETLTSCIANNKTINLPISVVSKNAVASAIPSTSCALPSMDLLMWADTAGNMPKNISGSDYVIQVRNTEGRLTGLVSLEQPLTNSSGEVDFNALGIAAKRIGANGGGVFKSTAPNMNGVGGGWSTNNALFPGIGQEGKLGYRTSVGAVMDNVYMRLDGLYPMRADLNMGNYSINNITDINVNGWINANNILANNVRLSYLAANFVQTKSLNASDYISTGGRDPNVLPAGSLFRTDVVKTGAVVANNAFGILSNSNNASNRILSVYGDNTGLLAANGFYFNGKGDNNLRGAVTSIDTFTRDGRTKPYTGYLKDRLPRYVLRGMVIVEDASNGLNSVRIAKPNCMAAAESQGSTDPYAYARIVAIPQVFNIYPEYQVDMDLGTDANNNLVYRIKQTRTGRDQVRVFATDYGSNWSVTIESLMRRVKYPEDNGVQIGGRALVQTYCDFGD